MSVVENKGRRLAAIVFTDVVGYSARMQRDEIGTMELVRADFAGMRERATRYDGEVLKSMGDGLLLCFSSVVQAVGCALEIQAEHAKRGPDALQHRIGIHLGDVFREGGDVTGDGVNIAARLETKARPGTICLSQSVYEAVKGKLPMQAQSLGLQTFKNIAEPITVYLIAPPDTKSPFAPVPQRAMRRHWPLVAVAVLAVAGGVYWGFRPSVAKVGAAGGATAKPVSEAGRLVVRARGLVSSVDATRDGAALAEQLARKATELEPESSETWAVFGYVSFYFYQRGWDLAPARLEAARAAANRALSLAPEQPEALLVLAYVSVERGGDDTQAEALFRRVLKADSHDNRARRGLSNLLGRARRVPEAVAVLREAITVDPGDPLSHYSLAALSVTNWDVPTAMKSVDAALALRSFSTGWTLKAIILANSRGDLDKMRQALENLTPAERTEDRPVYLLTWCALMERAPARALEAARLMSREYFEDLFFRGPKGWLTGRAHAMAGQENLARLDYVAAETLIRGRLANAPGSQSDKIALAITLALEGRTDEARRAIAAAESAAREQTPIVHARWLAVFYAVLGDDARAVAYLRQVNEPMGALVAVTPAVLRLDPWWDNLRGKPAFEALLIDPTYCPALR